LNIKEILQHTLTVLRAIKLLPDTPTEQDIRELKQIDDLVEAVEEELEDIRTKEDN
jgi:hypothetical protein